MSAELARRRRRLSEPGEAWEGAPGPGRPAWVPPTATRLGTTRGVSVWPLRAGCFAFSLCLSRTVSEWRVEGIISDPGALPRR